MEMAWYDIDYKQPPDKPIDQEYLVTVYCANQRTTEQVMVMTWETEVIKGFEQHVWKWRGRKNISTWEITHWMEKPKPAKRE